MARKKQGKVGEDRSETIRQLPVACSDEAAACDFVERQRWGDKPYCPICGGEDVYRMTGRDGQREKHKRLRCRGCGKLFSVRTGMVLEDSRIPLRHWCYALWRACTSKKGASALEIKRQTGLSYKSALFLMHRIRFAMAPVDGPKLTGIVEADESWIGGKPRYRQNRLPRHLVDRKPDNYFSRYQRRTPIFAAVQRNGEARVRVLPKVNAENLRAAVLAHIDLSARLMTDEYVGYIGVGKRFEGGHDAIAHKNRIYVRGDITTNTVEGFFALLKRGIHGTFHNVSRKHLQRYLDEFEFRWNHRELEDGDRVIAAIKGAEGKKLAYREPVKRAS